MAGVINGNQGRRAQRRSRMRPQSEINVTPLVDVMLVLLIIFMVTAPLLTPGINIDLPRTITKTISQDKDPLTISIEKGGKIYLGGAKQESEAIAVEEIAAKVQAIAENGYDQRIQIRGDRSVDYGTVVVVLGELKAAGFHRIGLVTEPPRGEKKQK